jgi:hypothetical protein
MADKMAALIADINASTEKIRTLTAELRAERLERERQAAEDGVTPLEAARRHGRLAGYRIVNALTGRDGAA